MHLPSTASPLRLLGDGLNTDVGLVLRNAHDCYPIINVDHLWLEKGQD